jgi:hypothetical protein
MSPPPAGGRDGEGGDTLTQQPAPLTAQPSAGMLEQMWASVHLASSAPGQGGHGAATTTAKLPIVGAPSLKSLKSVVAPSAASGGLLSSGDDASPAGSYIGAGEHPPRASGSGLGSGGGLPSCSEEAEPSGGGGGIASTRRGPVTRARLGAMAASTSAATTPTKGAEEAAAHQPGGGGFLAALTRHRRARRASSPSSDESGVAAAAMAAAAASASAAPVAKTAKGHKSKSAKQQPARTPSPVELPSGYSRSAAENERFRSTAAADARAAIGGAALPPRPAPPPAPLPTDSPAAPFTGPFPEPPPLKGAPARAVPADLAYDQAYRQAASKSGGALPLAIGRYVPGVRYRADPPIKSRPLALLNGAFALATLCVYMSMAHLFVGVLMAVPFSAPARWLAAVLVVLAVLPQGKFYRREFLENPVVVAWRRYFSFTFVFDSSDLRLDGVSLFLWLFRLAFSLSLSPLAAPANHSPPPPPPSPEKTNSATSSPKSRTPSTLCRR